MIWMYNQQTGWLSTNNASWQGYSGFPPHKDVPAAEGLIGFGPIPRGAYDVGDPMTHPDLGPVAVPLTARKFTDTHGRDGFYLHGDSINHPGQASHGCIVVPHAARVAFRKGDVLVVWA